MPTFFNTDTFASPAAAIAAIRAAGLEYDGGRFATAGVAYPYGERSNGVSTYRIAIFQGKPVGEAPVRSERLVYTPSGKKRTSRELCGRVFKKHAGDRKAFVAAAVALGVRPSTANAMFSHYTVGRYVA